MAVFLFNFAPYLFAALRCGVRVVFHEPPFKKGVAMWDRGVPRGQMGVGLGVGLHYLACNAVASSSKISILNNKQLKLVGISRQSWRHNGDLQKFQNGKLK